MTYALSATAGAFYAAPHRGDLYRSADAGRSWEPLHVNWTHPEQPERLPYVNALLAVE
jgi:hypothetical protein